MNTAGHGDDDTTDIHTETPTATTEKSTNSSTEYRLLAAMAVYKRPLQVTTTGAHIVADPHRSPLWQKKAEKSSSQAGVRTSKVTPVAPHTGSAGSERGGHGNDYRRLQRRVHKRVLRRPPSTPHFHFAHRVAVHRSASSAQPMRFTDDHLYRRGTMPHSAADRDCRGSIQGSATGGLGIRPHRSPHPTHLLRLIQ